MTAACVAAIFTSVIDRSDVSSIARDSESPRKLLVNEIRARISRIDREFRRTETAFFNRFAVTYAARAIPIGHDFSTSA